MWTGQHRCHRYTFLLSSTDVFRAPGYSFIEQRDRSHPSDCRTRDRVLELPIITGKGRTGTGFFFLLFTLSLRVRRIFFKKLNGDSKKMKPQDRNHFCRSHGKEWGLKLFCGCSPMKAALLCNAQAKTEHSNFPSSSPSHQDETGASQIKNRLMLQLNQTELFLFKCFSVSPFQ